MNSSSISSSTDNHLKYASGSKRSYGAMNQEGSSGEIFQVLPSECLNHILSFLSRKQLFIFEQLNTQTSAGFYTQHQWKIICLQKKLNFDWEDLKNYGEWKHDKIRFMMGRGLCDYALSRIAFMNQSANCQARSAEGSQAFANRYHRFAYLHQFPSLKAHIFQDIKIQAEQMNQSFPLEGGSQEPSFSEELKAGDQLLRGLYHLGKAAGLGRVDNQVRGFTMPEQFKKAEEYLESAIQKGAILASFIAIKYAWVNTPSHFASFAKIADLSIEKHPIENHPIKDYNGLRSFLFSLPPALLNNHFKDRRDPPLLEYRGNKAFQAALLDPQKEHLEAADKGYKEVIEAYGEHVLPQTWLNYSLFKRQWSLKEKDELKSQAYEEESLEYLNRAIAAYGEDVPFTAALQEMLLCENLQTEEYAKKFIQAYPHPKQKEEFRKKWLEEYREKWLLEKLNNRCRNKYLEFALLAYDRKEVPLPLLFTQVYIQARYLANDEEIKTLFNNALAIYKERQTPPSLEVLFVTAYMYFEEGNSESVPLKELYFYGKASSFLQEADYAIAKERREDYFLTMNEDILIEEITGLRESITENIHNVINHMKREEFEDPFNTQDILPN